LSVNVRQSNRLVLLIRLATKSQRNKPHLKWRTSAARVPVLPAVLLPPGYLCCRPFGLEKKTGPRDEACTICSGQALPDSSFEVVAALVGPIDGAKGRRPFR